jgi:tetratricopeptide (TPR) repeat protein
MCSKWRHFQFNLPVPVIGFLVITLLLLSSCKSYKVFTIDVFEPAEIIVPQSINHLIVAPNQFPERSDKKNLIYEVRGDRYYDTVLIDTIIARAATERLSGLLNFNRRFTAEVINEPDIQVPAHPNDFTNQHINELKKLCEKHDADALILLSALDKYLEYDVYVTYLGNPFSNLTAYLNTRWLFIYPSDSKLIDHRLISDTLAYQVDGTFGLNSPELLHYFKELLIATAEESAGNYGLRITPHFVQTGRIIFKSGNRNIRKGYKTALTGDWREAADFWREAINDADPVNRARACFNLALAAEMEGLLQPALEWAEKSRDFFSDELNHTYISILQERIRQQEELILQFDGQ